MLVRICVAASLVVIGFGSVLFASEEEFLVWNEVRIVSPKRDDTGQVVFVAKTEGSEYREITIEAFGKKFSVENEHLASFKGFPLSSLVTTHEAGYERLGGHTVHFKFKRAFYDPDGKLVQEHARVSVSRGKALTIAKPSRVVKD